MELWTIFSVAGLAFIILEMLIPSMFFLNLAVSGFATSIIAYFWHDWLWCLFIFCILSLASILLLRPLMMRKRENRSCETGMEAKYLGKTVKVIEDVDRDKGAISIYDERWNARADVDKPIKIGEKVKIIKYDSLILTVEKIKE